MDRWLGTVAIVTGASTAVGISIAEKLVEAGLEVVALARRTERLEELDKKLSGKRGKLYPVQTDVTKEEDIVQAFKWANETLGPVHILINYAGLTKSSLLTEQTIEEMNEIFRANVLGLCIATREAVKAMKENQVNGHIVHINSVVGHQVLDVPKANVYPATMHAVTALAETLRLELNHLELKIKITSISPGTVDTEIVTGKDQQSSPSEKVYRERVTELISKERKKLPVFQKLFNEKVILSPEDVTDAVLYVLSTPPHVQVHELTIRPADESENS